MAEFGISEPSGVATESKIVYSYTQNVIGNYSVITTTVQQRRTNSYTTTGTFAGTRSIDGTAYSFSWYGSYSTSWVTLASGSKTVYHNADGSKTVTLATTYSNSGTSQAGTYSGSANITLPKIDRTAPTFTTHSVNNVTTTSITINRVNNVACDQVQYSLNGGAWTTTTTGATYTISGLTENTSYTIKTRARKTSNQVWGESSTLTQQTHPNTVGVSQVIVTPLSTSSLRVDVVTNATSASDSVLTGRVHNIFITVNGSTQEATQYKYNLGTGQYADAGYFVYEGLTDNTTYIADVTVTTARSYVDTDAQGEGTTPPADFAKLVLPNGTVTGLRPMYMIDTAGIKTRLIDSDITVLPPS